ncbi:LRP2-binding protein [Gastrophryne carolinensis]
MSTDQPSLDITSRHLKLLEWTMKKLTSEPLPWRHRDILLRMQELPGFPKRTEAGKSAGCSHADRVQIAELYLKQLIEEGDRDAIFLLGQLFFEEERYEDAFLQFEEIKDEDDRALFQVGVMFYDGLGIPEDWCKGAEHMQRIVSSDSPRAKQLKYAAAYNLGLACFEGCGLRHSDEEAERWWLFAADNGNPNASVKAQNTLGRYYSRPCSMNLKKAFYWHSEACGNGNVESQGALGVMYLYGQGIQRNLQSALECLKEAAERGNVYAQGHLVTFYYRMKLYTKAAELAKRIVQYNIPDHQTKASDPCTDAAEGIAISSFYLARCLHLGLGVEADAAAAKQYYTKAFQIDPDVTAHLHCEVIFEKL